MRLETLLKALGKRAMSMPAYHDPRFPPSEYYRFFELLTAAMHPRLSVELGVCGGGASFHMARGWPHGTVVGVELPDSEKRFTDHERDNWAFIQRECPNFVLWRGDSVDSAPEIAKEYGEVDLLFVDTVHEFQRTIDEFNAWLPFLASRAVVAFDDLNRFEMDGLWDWVPASHKLRLDHLHDGGLDEDGFGDGGFGVAWGW